MEAQILEDRKNSESGNSDNTEALNAALQTPESQTLEQGHKLAKLLRSLGTLVIVAAAVSFLIQRWGGFEHLTRYFSFLSFTAALSGFGIFCGTYLKESKSARTLLALSGGLVVVNVAQLSALTFSYFSASTSSAHYPDFLYWKAASLSQSLIALGIGFPILIAIMAISLSVLAREIRAPLIKTAVALNLMLLIPTREASLATFLALAMTLLLVHLYRQLKGRSVVRTFEGSIVQMHLALPLLILIGRQVFLYGTTNMSLGFLLLISSIVIFNIVPQLFNEAKTQIFFQKLSIITTTLGWIYFDLSLQENNVLSSELFVPVLALQLIASLSVMSLKGLGHNKIERSLAVAVSFMSIVFQVVLYPGVASFSFALFLSIMIIAYGYSTKHKATLAWGIIGFVICLIRHVQFAIELSMVNPWVSLAILGTGTILIAAYAERSFPKYLAYFNHMNKRFSREA